MSLISNKKSDSFLGRPFSADDLFCDLPEKTLKSLKKIKKTIEYKKHHLIYDVGESPCFVNILIAGKANLFLKTNNDPRFVIRNIKPKEILGLVEALACFPYETGVETLSPCFCEIIKRQDLIELLGSDVEISFRMLKMLATDLQESYKRFTNLVIKT